MKQKKPKLITDLGTRRSGKKMKRFAIYSCPCCLNHYETQPYYVNSGNSKMCKSCSSKNRMKKKFGHIPSSLRKKFVSIKSRCYNKKNNQYKYYGLKNIKVLWKNSNEFGMWALKNGYKEGLTIERINPLKDYSSENCEWITLSENAIRSNLRSNYGNNKYIKISEDEASELCEAYDTKLFTYKELAKKYNTCSTTVGQIIRKARL